MHFYEAAEADPRYSSCYRSSYWISEIMMWVIFGLVFVVTICLPQSASFQIGLSRSRTASAQLGAIGFFEFAAALTFCIGYYWIGWWDNYAHVIAWFLIGFVGIISFVSFVDHVKVTFSTSSLITVYAAEGSYQGAPAPTIPQSNEKTAPPPQTNLVIPTEASELVNLQAERSMAIWMTVIMFLIMSASIVYMYFIFNCAWNIVLS
ncbi:Oidioi.mRNA.OKI2018_I69.PAR.g9822.t1.cds [Oikopleura dioica]|uniref:Oidioi.mRNA.OKI2018_I69.PAR.g9822.t1.cds n=1 Tax=Oikopleura dioica TaxID=34765 RepID=A0ABN7RRX1_OIKDI|nr:Oidioi.mRNA.OKI2018_I69.PAR.g9822.t1.cds [Oikopleura dioica]